MKMVENLTTFGATSSSSSAGAAATKPPAGIKGASGRFSRFFNASLNSETSNKFSWEIADTIVSIFGENVFSTLLGGGMIKGSLGVVVWVVVLTVALKKY